MAQTAAFKAEVSNGTPRVAAVLEVQWSGYGTKRYASVGGFGGAEGRVVEAGWGSVQPAISESSPQLGKLTVTVQLANTDRALDPILMGAYDQRRVPVTIYRASPVLSESDWDTRFVGIVDGWVFGPGSVTLNLSTDARKFEGFLPKVPILKSEFPAAPSASLGRYMPLLFGEFSSTGVGTGLLTAIPVNWVVSTTGWYLCCQGVAKEVTGVWVDNVSKTLTTHYTVDYAYSAGGRICTLIKFTSGNIPGESAVVSFDAKGYTSDGTTSGSLITNPAEILWTLLDMFIYSDQKTWTNFGYNKGFAPVDATSFSSVASTLSRYDIRGSRYLGGGTTQLRAEDVVNEFFDSSQWLRGYWDYSGNLCLTDLLPVHPGYPTGSSVVWDGGGDAEIEPLTFSTDSTQIRRRTSTSFLDSPKDGRQMFSLDVQDLNVDEDITVNVSAPWIASKAS